MRISICLIISFFTFSASAAPRSYERVSRNDAILTGALGVGAFLAYGYIPHSKGEWTEPLQIDLEARRIFRGETLERRRMADAWSDGTLSAAIAVPFLGDALLLSGARDGDWETAAQTFNIGLQSMAITGIMTASIKALVGRERPYARGCRLETMDDPECSRLEEVETYRSFTSGHSAYAFTAAGLACFHHSELRLFGSSGDEVTCAMTLAFATATAALRMTADKHYLSDVAAGSAIGLLSGYAVPRLSRKSREGSATPAIVLRGPLLPVLVNTF